jgi:hypothetical protein
MLSATGGQRFTPQGCNPHFGTGVTCVSTVSLQYHCGRAVSGTAVWKVLVYYWMHNGSYTGLYTVYNGAGVCSAVALLDLAREKRDLERKR